MGRAPCCDKANVKRGPWSPEEDTTLKTYVQRYGTGGNWIALPHKAGLKRCGKSCRLRWLNYLRPDIKHGGFTEEEDNTICTLYNSIGSRWSVIASQLPGRTDNDIKNYWNTKLKKKLFTGKTSLKNNNNITSNTNIHYSATPAASLTKAETTHNYGFSASLTTSSPTFPSSMEASYGQIVDPQRLVADPNHFPLSGCTEMLEFARSANNYSGSSSQEVSSLSGSSSAVVDNNYVSNWSGNVGGDQDGFLMDFSFGHPYDLLNGFGFHERTSEVAPNFSPNLANSPYTNLLANCSDTKPQGIHQSITN